MVIKWTAFTPVIWWREATSVTANSFGHTPFVFWLWSFVDDRMINVAFFASKLWCETTFTSPTPAAVQMVCRIVFRYFMASFLRWTCFVRVSMRRFHFININMFVEDLWIFHWIVRIYYESGLFSACTLKTCTVWNVVSFPVAKLWNVRMLLKWFIVERFVKHDLI